MEKTTFLTLKKNLVETSSTTPGKIISQSRIAGSEIVEGTTLTVDVAAAVTEIEGCTDSNYEEYNSKATKDNGSCKTKKQTTTTEENKETTTNE